LGGDRRVLAGRRGGARPGRGGRPHGEGVVVGDRAGRGGWRGGRHGRRRRGAGGGRRCRRRGARADQPEDERAHGVAVDLHGDAVDGGAQVGPSGGDRVEGELLGGQQAHLGEDLVEVPAAVEHHVAGG